MTKQDIRQKMLLARAGLTRDEVARKSRRIIRNFLDLPLMGQYPACLVYLPVRNEVDTRSLILEMVARSKEVYAPKCDCTSCTMDYYRVTGLDSLEPGSFGIDEPCPDSAQKFINKSKAMCILPGLAFDRCGVRLGYGRGFFDRYLSGLTGPKPLLIGFGYDFQVTDQLPRDEWDVPVDMIVAEQGVLETG
ncbi:5-formyltetrahydrofolate cyclo-ligase [Desulfonatronovibrio hydrogenovorans]|uniref:5-formyltetrahydrofolate cyclo-ligase n=1 Tax=Desulfonatronovibrio hydrogenovorans TaxID=53245 RepID=UPI00068B2020|nr:5-formyltetrahydrofolate cyclo-ligase [Desulfonatronovibrio hydrogenovorans]